MKQRIFILVLVVFLLSPGGRSLSAQTGKDGPMAKLTHSLVKLHDQYATRLAQRSAALFSSGDPVITLVGDRVVVDAVASKDVNLLKADLESLGMQQAVAFGRIVSGQLPVSALPAAASMASLQFAQPPVAITNVGNVTSQGDQAMRSNVARTNFGVNGSGVTVGVLSNSFNCLGGAAADVTSGDLSPVTVVQEIGSCGVGTDEGRAMLQIVHDVAPGASLAFASAFNGTASFATNIQSLAAAGAKVIVDDVIYFAEPFFQDGILAQAVNNVVAGGSAYFSSAGNQARQSYQSTFRAGGVFAQGSIPSAAGAPPFFGGTAHNFDPGGGTDVFQRITLPPDAGFIMSFQWDSPAFSVSGAPGSSNDLDVYVLNAAASQVVAGANIDNLGNDPIEVFSFTNTTGVTADFNIMIVNFSGPNPGLIKYVLFNLGGTIQEFATNSGTIFGHPNAVGAEAVGAARYSQTPAFGVSPPQLEPFSSAGGTPILFGSAGNRLPTAEIGSKPEIVAPDGGDTTFFGTDTDGNGFPNFFGTSAAVSHAAGLAALLFQSKPSSTPIQIYAALENTAIDMGAPGFDYDSGFGLIQADTALAVSPDGLSNISTRGSVLTGDNVMIGGFIIEGTVPKTVLIRARGPSMSGAPFSIPGTLANPFLQIFSGSTSIAQNDNWQTADPLCASMGFTCGGPTEIAATDLDPCQPNPGQSTPPPGCAQESAILITLPPGAYTAIESGVGGGSGLGLVEVFEVDGGASPSKLINISTRGRVGTGDNVMIGGFTISGSSLKTVLLRGRGPSMGGVPFSIPGTLANPFLQIFSGSTAIAQNDNWQTTDPLCATMGFACGGAAEIAATVLDPCQPNPGQSTSPSGCAQESAILITLAPGAYTAIVTGVGGGTGVGLIEVFEIN
ncbi:MAG TPA: S8 family serine peptidase [Candidatus Binatia bacterium]